MPMPESWRRVRQTVLDRDLYECQLKLAGCTHNAIDVWRTNASASIRAFGELEPDNCVAICRPCLAIMTAKRTAGARMAGDRLRQTRLEQRS